MFVPETKRITIDQLLSILQIIAKIFEKHILQQLSSHFDNMFSKFQCGFQIAFGTNHCLSLTIGKRKKALD